MMRLRDNRGQWGFRFPKRKKVDASIRFWRKVQKSVRCWSWMAATDEDGYGSFTPYPHGPTLRAHRYAWEFSNGPIPPKLCVLHSCDNPACVNPDHLFLGTTTQNNADRDSKGRTARGESSGKNLLTVEMVRRIRALYRGRAFGPGRIASKLNLPYDAVRGVLDGRTWRHVV